REVSGMGPLSREAPAHAPRSTCREACAREAPAHAPRNPSLEARGLRGRAEPVQDLREQKIRTVKPAHSMRAEEEDMRGLGSLQNCPHGGVEGPVHALEGVGYSVPHLPIVRRMRRIVEMPALVPDTVGLREHLNGEIPMFSVEELERQSRLL